MHLIDDDLQVPVVQLRHALDASKRTFGEFLAESFVGVPTHGRDHAATVLQLQKQVRVALSIGSQLPIGDFEDRIDLDLREQLGDVLASRGVGIHGFVSLSMLDFAIHQLLALE